MVVLILFFIIYYISVFLINNIYALLGFNIFNIFLMLIFKIKLKKVIKNLLNILIFTIFVFCFNLIFSSVLDSLIVAWKIIIVTNFAFIFSSKISKTSLASGLSKLLYPLKIFKIDTDDIALMLVIAFNFITIISEEIKTLKLALRARNVKLNLKTVFTKTHIIFILFFANLFRKVNYLEKTLIIRGKKSTKN